MVDDEESFGGGLTKRGILIRWDLQQRAKSMGRHERLLTSDRCNRPGTALSQCQSR